MANAKKNQIFWVICNKKTLESELHELRFQDTEEGTETYWERIQYLVSIHSKRGKTIKAEFQPNNVCVLTVWS